jgi:hypothetical protein
MKPEDAATLSNVIAMTACAPVLFIFAGAVRNESLVTAIAAAILLCLLALAYTFAKRIPDCRAPARRVSFIWSYWVAIMFGIALPLGMVLKEKNPLDAWPFLVVGGAFALQAFISWWSLGGLSGKDT